VFAANDRRRDDDVVRRAKEIETGDRADAVAVTQLAARVAEEDVFAAAGRRFAQRGRILGETDV
jgi:hypothetical protein